MNITESFNKTRIRMTTNNVYIVQKSFVADDRAYLRPKMHNKRKFLNAFNHVFWYDD